MNNIVFVDGDDWFGVYINDKLEDEGHSISSKNLIELMFKHQPIESFEYKYADGDWLYEVGRMPKDLKMVRFEDE